jgi:hypothetical protein
MGRFQQKRGPVLIAEDNAPGHLRMRALNTSRPADNAYRAKALECLSLAEWMNDPEERAEIVRFAEMWMSLAEPIDEGRGAYEFPR